VIQLVNLDIPFLHYRISEMMTARSFKHGIICVSKLLKTRSTL